MVLYWDPPAETDPPEYGRCMTIRAGAPITGLLTSGAARCPRLEVAAAISAASSDFLNTASADFTTPAVAESMIHPNADEVVLGRWPVPTSHPDCQHSVLGRLDTLCGRARFGLALPTPKTTSCCNRGKRAPRIGVSGSWRSTASSSATRKTVHIGTPADDGEWSDPNQSE